jgi:uncharacterized protein
MKPSLSERVIGFSVKNARFVVIATVVATLVFAWFAVRVRVNPDFVAFLPENAELNRIQKEYSNGAVTTDMMVVAADADASGGDVFDPARLEAFSEAVDLISAHPDVQSTVSPFNLVTFGREGGRLGIRPMSPGGRPPSADEIPAFRARLLSVRYAPNLVVSRDGTMLIAYFQARHKGSYTDLMKTVNKASALLRAAGLTPYVTGWVPANVEVSDYLTGDLTRLLILAALIVILFYAGSFRSLRYVVLPLISVLFGTLWTVGFMGIMGYALSLISVAAPPLIMIFGNEYNIYTASELDRLSRATGNAAGWIGQAGRNVVKPIAMAFLTTVVGFMSLFATEINGTREFAITASFGSLACAFLALVFLPALFTFLKPSAPRAPGRYTRFTEAMRRIARFTMRRPVVVFSALAAVLVLFGLTMPLLVFNTDTGTYYPPNDKMLLDTYAIYRKAGGYEQLYVSFDAPGGAPGYFLDAAALDRVQAVERALLAHPNISYAISLPDLLHEVNIAATGADAIPTNRAVVSMFSRLLTVAGGSSASGSILGALSNKDFSRVTIALRIHNAAKHRFVDEGSLRALLVDVRKILADNPTGAAPVIWGDQMRILSFTESLRRSLFESMGVSVLLVLAFTMIVFRSPRHGVYALVPLATGLLLNFSLMALFHIPLDVSTIMVSTIALGIGVDSAIYMIIQYRRELAERPGDPDGALEETLAVMGRPVLLSNLSIAGGMLMFMFATFRPVMYFGLLVMITLVATAGGTLITLPMLLGLDGRARRRRASRQAARAVGSP